MKKIYLIVSLLLLASVSSYSQNWDIDLLKNINAQNPGAPSAWKELSNSSYMFEVSIPVGAWLISKMGHDKKLEKRSYEIAGSLIINAIAAEGLKTLIHRERPYQKYPLVVHAYDNSEKDNSFPSGHTSFAFATATSLSIQFKKWWVVVPAYAWAASVGYSRLYLGEHYPTDVLAGAVVGAGSAWLSHWINKKYFSKSKK